MPRQVRKQRTPQRSKTETVSEDVEQAENRDGEKAAHEYTDEVLADIDAALEGLDQNLAREYLQKGGQ